LSCYNIAVGESACFEPSTAHDAGRDNALALVGDVHSSTIASVGAGGPEEDLIRIFLKVYTFRDHTALGAVADADPVIVIERRAHAVGDPFFAYIGVPTSVSGLSGLTFACL
jgi:hypothetical protein